MVFLEKKKKKQMNAVSLLTIYQNPFLKQR